MTATLRRIGNAFGVLYDVTSNQTLPRSVYRDARPEDGLYSITNTQPGETTYRAGVTSANGGRHGSAPTGDVTAVDGEKARTRPTRDPISADD